MKSNRRPSTLLGLAILIGLLSSNSQLPMAHAMDGHELRAKTERNIPTPDLSDLLCKLGIGCPPKKGGELTYIRTKIRKPKRGDDTENFPYIVYPRRTLVLEARPMLIWHDTQAPPYTVSILDFGETGDTIWRQTNVLTNSLRYPESAPALAPGNIYLLEVIDSKGQSSVGDPETGLGFKVLSASDQKDVAAQPCVAESQDLKPADKAALVLAWCYANWKPKGRTESRGLWGTAWLQLHQLMQKSPQTKGPWIWNRMGDLQLTMSGFKEAVFAYQRALEEATAPGRKDSWADTVSTTESKIDAWTLGKADALAGLWRSTGEKAQKEEAKEEAIELYQALGNQEAVKALIEEK